MAQSLSFYKGSSASFAGNYNAGCVYFENDTHLLKVGKGGDEFEVYSGIISASFENNVLKLVTPIREADGKYKEISLDFSDVASAENVNSILGGLRTDIDEIKESVAGLGKPAVLYTAEEAEAKNAETGAQEGDENFVKEGDVKEAATGIYKDVEDVKKETGENVAGQVSALEERVEALEGVLGDEEGGLAKDVEDVKSILGDESEGLVKEVADNASAISGIQDVVGNSEGGLVKDVNDLQTEVGGLESSISDAKTAADNAQEAADNAQSDVDALSEVIGSAAVEEESHEATEEDVLAGKAEAIGEKVIDVPGSDATGLFKEIEDAKVEAASKVSSVSAGDASVEVGGTTAQPTVSVAISAEEGNSLSLKEDGLFVTAQGQSVYTLVKKETPNSGAIATYQLQKDGEDVEDSYIDLAEDLVVSGGVVRKLTDEEVEDGKGDANKDYIVLTISSGDLLYINAEGLVEAYKAGEGIEISEAGEISVKVSEAEGNKLTLDEDGALQVLVDDTKTSKDISVLGGPLANNVEEGTDNWPAAWVKDGKKIIPEGTTFESFIMNLFYAVKWGTLSNPTYTWNPSLTNTPNASLSLTGDQIVGTEVTITFSEKDGVSGNIATGKVNITDGYGYSVDGANIVSGTSKTVNAAAGTTSGTLVATGTWKAGSASAVSVESGATMAIVEGTNTLSVSQSGLKAQPGQFSEVNVYNVSNAGDISAEDKKTIDEAGFEASSAYAGGEKTLAAKSSSASVTGYYPIYKGLLSEPISEFTEEVLKVNGAKAVPTTLTTAVDSKGYFVAVPVGSTYASKSKLTIKNATETAQFGVAAAQDGVVEINVAGSAKKNYKVFYFANAAQWDKVETFGKFIWS